MLVDRDTPERFGGLALWAFGGMALVGTPLQGRMKIPDTPERALQDWLRFGVHPLQHRLGLVTLCTAQVLDRRIVSDSGGHRESRWVIATPLRLGTAEWTIELTLTDRDSMLFRMLLGRSAMSGRLLVDPQGSYLASRKPRLKRLYPALAAGDPPPR